MKAQEEQREKLSVPDLNKSSDVQVTRLRNETNEKLKKSIRGYNR